MRKITREEFNKMAPKVGGDLWNIYKLCDKAFSLSPHIEAIEAIEFNLTTGLWCDVDLISSNGTRKTYRIYE